MMDNNSINRTASLNFEVVSFLSVECKFSSGLRQVEIKCMNWAFGLLSFSSSLHFEENTSFSAFQQKHDTLHV